MTAWLLMMWVGFSVPAHPVHVSLGEAEWTGSALEVTLDVRTDDLERALKGPISDAGVAVLLAKKVRLVKATEQKPATLSFVGLERHGTNTSLFFEFPVGGDPQDYRLALDLFFDLERSQRHTVVVTRGKARRTLRFTHKHRERALWR